MILCKALIVLVQACGLNHVVKVLDAESVIPAKAGIRKLSKHYKHSGHRFSPA
jgi:hypothetical protein